MTKVRSVFSVIACVFIISNYVCGMRNCTCDVIQFGNSFDRVSTEFDCLIDTVSQYFGEDFLVFEYHGDGTAKGLAVGDIFTSPKCLLLAYDEEIIVEKVKNLSEITTETQIAVFKKIFNRLSEDKSIWADGMLINHYTSTKENINRWHYLCYKNKQKQITKECLRFGNPVPELSAIDKFTLIDAAYILMYDLVLKMSK